MSFERDSVFSDQISDKKSRPSKSSGRRGPDKKDEEGLDDIFGEKDKSSRVPVKHW